MGHNKKRTFFRRAARSYSDERLSRIATEDLTLPFGPSGKVDHAQLAARAYIRIAMKWGREIPPHILRHANLPTK